MNTLNLGDKAPDFSLQATDMKTYSLSSFDEKRGLLIIFSCNHCPYVHAYEERIKDIQKKYGDRGIQVLAINANDAEKYPEDSFEKMKLRAKQERFNFIYLRDETQEVAKAYGAVHTPHLFLFDKDRNLVYTGKIDDNWQEPEKVHEKYLENALDELLAGKEISVPETFAIGCTIKWK